MRYSGVVSESLRSSNVMRRRAACIALNTACYPSRGATLWDGDRRKGEGGTGKEGSA